MKENEKLKADLQKKEDELELNDDRIHSLQTENITMLHSRERLKSKVQILQEEKSSLGKDRDALQKRNEDLQQQLDNQMDNNAALEKYKKWMEMMPEL